MATVDLRVARRYANALFNAAKQSQALDRVQNDLGELKSLCETHQSFKGVWFSPRIPVVQKSKLVADLFKSSIDPVSLAFLGLLVDKRREDILPVMADEVRRLVDAEGKVIRAHATFAVHPSEPQLAAITASLQSRTGQTIKLTHDVNADIIGGVVVRLNDDIIDGSVRGSLERMRVSMLQEA